MQMFYITRYEHNPNKDTEYYVGGGRWLSIRSNRISPRLYDNEDFCKVVVQGLDECDWHSLDIQN